MGTGRGLILNLLSWRARSAGRSTSRTVQVWTTYTNASESTNISENKCPWEQVHAHRGILVEIQLYKVSDSMSHLHNRSGRPFQEPFLYKSLGIQVHLLSAPPPPPIFSLLAPVLSHAFPQKEQVEESTSQHQSHGCFPGSPAFFFPFSPWWKAASTLP